MTIISLIIAGWSVCALNVKAQGLPLPTTETVTPKFVPVGQRPTSAVQTGFTLPVPPQSQPNNDFPVIQPLLQPQAQPKVDPAILQPRSQAPQEDINDLNLRTELPGMQRLFMRESELQFYERVRQDAKKYAGANPAVFPTEEPVISRESYVQPNYPRWDPRTQQPFASSSTKVEPCYVMHRRLLFEQPNFERGLYDLGVAQPLVSLGVFYYDVAMAPYHIWSDLQDQNESSLGKCLPGDAAPFTVTCEKFSVTGLVGEAGAIFGLSFLFP